MRGWGVDGCWKGWFYFGLGDGPPEYGVVSTLGELMERVEPSVPVFVDIPIGLLSQGRGERSCDLEARRLLSPGRSSSVFPTPSRPAVYAGSYEESQQRNREALGKGLSKAAAWGIVPEIREVVRTAPQPSPEGFGDRLLGGRIRKVVLRRAVGRPMVHSIEFTWRGSTTSGRHWSATSPAWLPSPGCVREAYLEHVGVRAASGQSWMLVAPRGPRSTPPRARVTILPAPPWATWGSPWRSVYCRRPTSRPPAPPEDGGRQKKPFMTSGPATRFLLWPARSWERNLAAESPTRKSSGFLFRLPANGESGISGCATSVIMWSPGEPGPAFVRWDVQAIPERARGTAGGGRPVRRPRVRTR